MVVPDRQLIIENMLMAEGFVNAKLLATKFASLYSLLEDLLTPAKHYDWGLRAIKSVLVVAGRRLHCVSCFLALHIAHATHTHTHVACKRAHAELVAGGLLRAQAGQDETDVLYRALRDFNLPKILDAVCWRG